MDDASACNRAAEASDDLLDALSAEVEFELGSLDELHHEGDLYTELKERAGEETPRCDPGDIAEHVDVGGAIAEIGEPIGVTDAEEDRCTDDSGDLGDVPQHWSDVRQEELPVAVQDAEAPAGKDEHAGGWKDDPHERDGEVEARVVGVAEHDRPCDLWREDDAEDDDERCRKSEHGRNGPGNPSRFFFVPFDFGGVHGDERRRKGALAEEHLENVGDAGGDTKGVARSSETHKRGEDSGADDTGQTRQKDSCGDED